MDAKHRKVLDSDESFEKIDKVDTMISSKHFRVNYVTGDELRERIAGFKEQADQLGLNYADLKELDWNGTSTVEEYQLFEQWSKALRLLGEPT